MRQFFRGIFVLLTLMTIPSVWAHTNPELDQSINTHYLQLMSAFNKLDIAQIDALYADNACYLPEGQNKAIIIGKDNILELHRSFFSRIKAKQARIEVDFRVIDRQITGQQVTDVGYFLVRFFPAPETGESTSEFAGKYVSVLEQNKDGIWQMMVDSSHRADPSLFFSAKPVDKLYYGESFSPLITMKE
ncbi:YybH family protein [Shewanella sp. GXUN23E]|uniref:YybH family protein n=1 Tax=Shewanella sp. GXUN23E TaxID=3422498 RepID=UPI003D7DC0E3